MASLAQWIEGARPRTLPNAVSPVIAGMVLSIPVVALTSARAPGEALRRAGVFAIPEERAPPPILQRAEALRRG